jgi:hypothetical protein
MAQTDDAVLNALSEELNRNKSQLKIDKLKPVKYLEYAVSNSTVYEVKAAYGAIISEDDKKIAKPYMKLIVGEGKRTNQNYITQQSLWGWDYFPPVNYENDITNLKINFWSSTDYAYKDATEAFENKVSTMSQQSIDDELLNLSDFYESEKKAINIDDDNITINKQKWSGLVKDLSAEFAKYTEIENAIVDFKVYDSYIYYVNSEGTRAKYPLTLYAIKAKVSTHASNGEELNDYMLEYAVKESFLPTKEVLLKQVNKLAQDLTALKSAEIFNDAYAGPVLFEGQAAAEVFAQIFLKKDNALFAKREPIIEKSLLENSAGEIGNTSNKLDFRFDKKIISRDLSIVSMPSAYVKSTENIIGQYPIDAEGVVPAQDLTLVGEGVLKAFMNDRIPAKMQKTSNGHMQWTLSNDGIVQDKGAGIVELKSKTTFSNKKLVEKMKSIAQEEDLDYVLIVRKVKNNNSGLDEVKRSWWGNDSKPKSVEVLSVYKHEIKTGKETLVRSIELDRLSMSNFKKIVGVSDANMIYNTMVKSDKHVDLWWQNSTSTLNGLPTTIIMPNALLFEELELQKSKKIIIDTPPVNSSPLSQK